MGVGGWRFRGRTKELVPAPCASDHHVEPPRIRYEAQRVAAVGAHLVRVRVEVRERVRLGFGYS